MDRPQAVISLAIQPKTPADREKLGVGLGTLMAEDSTLQVHTDQEAGQVIIAGMGERHLEIVVDRLRREFHIEAAVGKPSVVYKEMLTRPADGEAKYAKQANGRGQYAHVKIRVDPGEQGTGHVFENEVGSGTIPNAFIKPIEDGIKDALARSPRSGYPIDDVRVDLCGGSYHDVDSSEAAFRIAGAMAFQSALKRARPVLLEPMMRVEVVMPKDDRGDVVDNLASRRAQIRSQEDRGGAVIVVARVPLSQMLGYAADLRWQTQRRATYSMLFDGYEPVHNGPESDGEDRSAPVMAPRTPRPKDRYSAIALPEPDDEGSDLTR